MSSWPYRQLGDVLELAYGKSLPKNSRVEAGDIPVYGSNGITGWHNEPMLQGPTVIVGRKGSAGAVQYVDGPCFPIDTTYFVQPRAGFSFDYKFLYYLLVSLDLSRLKTATGVPGLTRDDAYKEQIPVPALSEQCRIVDILSRAEGIVRLQQQALGRAKALIPALFVELFGDPAMNPKGWPLVRLGDLALRMSDGPFGSNLKSSHYTDEGVRVLRLQNIGVGYLNDEDQAFVSAEHFATLQKHRCIPDDVIIGTLGDPNLRAIILPPSIEEALNKADCVQFRCDRTRVLPGYICWLMNHPSTLGLAATMVQGITRTRISMGRLRELFIPCPALDVQQEFATRLAEAQSIITQQTAALAKSREMFDALLAQTFSTPSIE